MWHFNYLEWLSSFILPVLFSLSLYSSYISLALLNFIPATFYISFQALVSLPVSFYLNYLFHKYRRPGPAPLCRLCLVHLRTLQGGSVARLLCAQ